MKPSKEAIKAMMDQVLRDLALVRSANPPDEAMAGVETFVALASRVFAKTNRSKIIDEMRTVEIQARMDGKKVYE